MATPTSKTERCYPIRHGCFFPCACKSEGRPGTYCTYLSLRTQALCLKRPTRSSTSCSLLSRQDDRSQHPTTCRATFNVCLFFYLTVPLTNFMDTLVFIHAQDKEDAALLESQIPTIVTLTKGGKSASVVRDPATEIPEGCGSAVVTSNIVIHTLVRVRLSYLRSWFVVADRSSGPR